MPAGDLLAGAQLTLHPGELVVLIGPSGAGKTMLLRRFSGSGSLDAGPVTLGVVDDDSPIGGVGYVPSDEPIHDGLIVGVELLYAASPSNLSIEASQSAVDQVLAQRRAHAHRPREPKPATLSKGDSRRVRAASELVGRLSQIEFPATGGPPVLAIIVTGLVAVFFTGVSLSR